MRNLTPISNRNKTMPDDKTKRKIDAWFLSLTEKYEVDYFVRDILDHVPGATREQVLQALDTCVENIKPSEGRARLKACVLSKVNLHSPTRPDLDDRPKHPSRTHA